HPDRPVRRDERTPARERPIRSQEGHRDAVAAEPGDELADELAVWAPSDARTEPVSASCRANWDLRCGAAASAARRGRWAAARADAAGAVSPPGRRPADASPRAATAADGHRGRADGVRRAAAGARVRHHRAARRLASADAGRARTASTPDAA